MGARQAPFWLPDRVCCIWWFLDSMMVVSSWGFGGGIFADVGLLFPISDGVSVTEEFTR